jgi:hypothetical protein
MKYKVNTDSVLMGVLEGLGAPPNIFRISLKIFIALQAKQSCKIMPDAI